jgi:hypothetical protein
MVMPSWASLDRHALGLTLDAHRSLNDVPERGHVRKQVETLEHHADLRALAADVTVR